MSKANELSISGDWQLISKYNNFTGEYKWEETAPRRTMYMTLTNDKKFYFTSDVPEGNGNYSYNPQSRYLSFQNPGAGTETVVYVSELNADYIVLDYLFLNSSDVLKEKYRRIR